MSFGLQRVPEVKNHMCAFPKIKATILSRSYFSGINLFRLSSTCQSVILLVEYVISSSFLMWSCSAVLYRGNVKILVLQENEKQSTGQRWEGAQGLESGQHKEIEKEERSRCGEEENQSAGSWPRCGSQGACRSEDCAISLAFLFLLKAMMHISFHPLFSLWFN